MAKEERRFCGTGRRKSSVARVILTPGTGKITVNGRDVNEYMPFATLVMDLKQPLVETGCEETFDVICNVNGGGFSGQTGAIKSSKKSTTILKTLEYIKNYMETILYSFFTIKK